MDQLIMSDRQKNRLSLSFKITVTLLVAVVTSITLYAMVPIADGFSRDFRAWLEGLPADAFVPASIIACTAWSLSMYLLIRRRLAKGDQ